MSNVLHLLFDDIKLILVLLELVAVTLDQVAGGLVIVLANLLCPFARVVYVVFDSHSLILVGLLISAEHVIMASKVFGMWAPCA